MESVYAPKGASGAGAFSDHCIRESEGNPSVVLALPFEEEKRVFPCIYLAYPCKYLMNSLAHLTNTLETPYKCKKLDPGSFEAVDTNQIP